MVCTIPYNILGGIIVTTKQSYADNDFAVYQCNSGYVMSGTAYVTCKNGTWSAPPSCVQVARNQVSVNDTTEYSEFYSLLFFCLIHRFQMRVYTVCKVHHPSKRARSFIIIYDSRENLYFVKYSVTLPYSGTYTLVYKRLEVLFLPAI